jgi:hypothetical protein
MSEAESVRDAGGRALELMMNILFGKTKNGIPKGGLSAKVKIVV